MERKLIKQGLGGYTVYLPKKWIDERGLKQGDSVVIDEAEGALVIAGKGASKREVTVTIGTVEEKAILILLSQMYR